MRLFDLSLRFKLPLWGGGLIVATALTLSTSFVAQAWDTLNQDLLRSAQDFGRTMAHSLFPVLLHDDVWEAFEVVTLPFAANPGSALADSLIVLDASKRIYVSSQPQEHPVLADLADLGTDLAALDRDLPMDPDADVFVRNVSGSQRIYVAVPIASDGVRLGTLIVAYSRALLWQRFQLIALRSMWITLLVLGLLLAVTFYWGRRMMLPMQMVTERISRIGSGDLESFDPALYPYKDEVGLLLLAYEKVFSKLKEKAEFEKEMVKSERLAAVGRLTASIAHEINNPLGGMLNAISTLKRHGSPDAVTQKTVSLLERGLSQIRETVAALLIETKHKSRPLMPSDLEDVRILVSPGANKLGVQLFWVGEMPAEVSMPSTLVRQVLLNLSLNAIAAAGQGGRVAVRVLASDARLVMVVENNGRSIPPEQLKRLFEPFTHFTEGGSGLGLWICYQIVTQLGGTIDAESNGIVTRFTVVIPLESNDATNSPQNLPG